jgi:hypothetical protein
VEKKQSELCYEILRRFHKAGILDDLILIGSWSVYFYRDYFKNVPYIDQSALRTRDIDFLISRPATIKHKVNIPELLKDLGFVTIYSAGEGYIKLDHPDLILEFLVPEKGRGTDKPVPLAKLGINATALRFLNFLVENTIKAKVENFNVILPHPVNFALHKLIISQRRSKGEKAQKDKDAAIAVLRALIAKGERNTIKQVFGSMPPKWQKKVRDGLAEAEERAILGS